MRILPHPAQLYRRCSRRAVSRDILLGYVLDPRGVVEVRVVRLCLGRVAELYGLHPGASFLFDTACLGRDRVGALCTDEQQREVLTIRCMASFRMGEESIT